MRDLKSRKSGKIKGNRRRQERQPRDWKKLFHLLLRLSTLGGSAALVISGGFFTARLVFDSGFFRVETVRVLNQQRVSEEEIRALSDIRVGTSIFELDLEMIGRKIEENPWVASARVERVFPREVVIRISERSPVAVVNLGYLYYVDETGEIFKLLAAEDSLDYPVVTGIDRRTLLENPPEGRRRLLEAMSLLRELAGRRVFALKDVSEVRIDPAEGLVVHTCTGGVPIRMGYDNFASKLDRLERIYPELEPRLPVLRYIDLNVADRVIVRVDTRHAIGNG